MSQPVLLTREAAVATLTLNRPDELNALDFAMVDALVDQIKAVAGDDSLQVVRLRAAGRHFMAGGDIQVFARELDHPRHERRRRFQAMVEQLHVAIENLHRMPHPVIAQVHGAVAGFGLSLMNACDLVVAADDTYFTSAYRHIALTPDGGGSWALPRIVGIRKAMELVLLSERFDAPEALRLGLVNRVVARADLDTATQAIVDSLAAAPRVALRNAKRLVRESFGRTLAEQLQAEATSFAECSASTDFEEGVRAFLDKRRAQFGQC
jgi:2-(1,2-epoxy-1,2-dihydrophenyl)acetyl-CoA isomerase